MIVQQIFNDYPNSLNTVLLTPNDNKSISLSVTESIVNGSVVKTLLVSTIDNSVNPPNKIDCTFIAEDLRDFMMILQNVYKNVI